MVIPNVPHNVFQRGNNRRNLFSYDADRVRLLDCLERGVAASGCLVHQLTLMTNHVHLIVTPPTKDGLAVLLHRSSQRYAQQRNARRGASGKLFEERYHSRPIEDEKHLMTVTLYNDANAVRAGVVATVFEHRWSTGALHAGLPGSRIPATLWTPSRWYLGLAATPDGRATIYRDLMTTYLAKKDAGAEGDFAPDDDLVPDVEPPYKRRVERPDRSYAREVLRFGPGRR